MYGSHRGAAGGQGGSGEVEGWAVLREGGRGCCDGVDGGFRRLEPLAGLREMQGVVARRHGGGGRLGCPQGLDGLW